MCTRLHGISSRKTVTFIPTALSLKSHKITSRLRNKSISFCYYCTDINKIVSIGKTKIFHPVCDIRDNKHYTVINICFLNILALCIANNSVDVCLLLPLDGGQFGPKLVVWKRKLLRRPSCFDDEIFIIWGKC
jgi:hypothetical protein